MASNFMQALGTRAADQDQEALNQEIRGGARAQVPPVVRANLEHVADADEHPPAH